MKKLLGFCLLVLLLVSCGKTTERQLTLIFEGTPENGRTTNEIDSVASHTEKEKESKKNAVRELYYFSTDRWIEKYVPREVNDTLHISCGEDTHVEFYHSYRPHAYHYALLQAGDTVYVRYEPDGTPVYRSSISNTLTTLYNGDVLIFGKPPMNFRDELYYNIDRSLSLQEFEKSQGSVSFSYPSLDSLLQVHELSLLKVGATIDSLVEEGIMLSAYRQYYGYRLQRLALEPEVIRLTVPSFSHPSLSEDMYGFFNDDFSHNISYWHTVGLVAEPLLREGGEWKPPIIELSDDVRIVDETAMFDRLELYAAAVPPATLNMMRYYSLIRIGTPEYKYPQEVYLQYFEKYRRHTTDFLIPSYVPVGETVNFPFRFFIFFLQFIVCSGAFFAIYVSLLKDKVGFYASRVYLLASLVLSVAIPLVTLPEYLVVLPDSALFWNSIFGSFFWLAFYVYLFGSLYMLGSYAWQLYGIRKMWNESWRIPDGEYTLCILTDAEVRPFMFFRNIFFSWNDWWNNGSKENRSKILEHEVAHVKLRHSLDGVLLMLYRILCWANPLLRTYSNEIKRVNEFAADRAVAKVYGTSSYMQALRESNYSKAEVRSALVNSNNDRLTERFEKMNTKVAWYKNVRLLLIVPLTILLMLLFSSELLVNVGSLPEGFGIPW